MFKYDGKDESILMAVDKANDKRFLRAIKSMITTRTSFEMSNATPKYLADSMEDFLNKNEIFIKVYYPRWRWSRAIGYYSPSNPLNINLNGYKLNRSTMSFVGTFYHELAHMMDHFDDKYYYHHGDNSPDGKHNTFPYFLSYNINRINDGNAYDDTSHRIKTSLLDKIRMFFAKLF